MGGLIDDDVLNAFAVVGEPEAVGKGLAARWGDVAGRITLYAPYEADPSVWPRILSATSR